MTPLQAGIIGALIGAILGAISAFVIIGKVIKRLGTVDPDPGETRFCDDNARILIKGTLRPGPQQVAVELYAVAHSGTGSPTPPLSPIRTFSGGGDKNYEVTVSRNMLNDGKVFVWGVFRETIEEDNYPFNSGTPYTSCPGSTTTTTTTSTTTTSTTPPPPPAPATNENDDGPETTERQTTNIKTEITPLPPE